MITKLSFALIMLSSILHPLWNMLLKRSQDKVIFYLNIHLVFTVMFSFILLFFPLKNITLLGWIFVLLSSLTHFFYQIFLCRSYELGDLSLAYPVARSAPVFVLFMSMFFLREMPSKEALLGIGAVIGGVQIINQKKLSFCGLIGSFKHFDKKTMIAALLTAFASACYSVVDKKGASLMDPILFFYLFFAISGFLFLVYLLFFKEKRRNYFKVLRVEKFKIITASLLESLSYILILYSFNISKVVYVVSLRQVSVIFGALYGILFLKEKNGNVRFVGALVIFIGIFLITVYG